MIGIPLDNLSLSEQGRKRIPKPLAEELKRNYLEKWRGLPDDKLLVEIEKTHRQPLIESVCDPFGYREMGCIVLAALVAREAECCDGVKP